MPPYITKGYSVSLFAKVHVYSYRIQIETS